MFGRKKKISSKAYYAEYEKKEAKVLSRLDTAMSAAFANVKTIKKKQPEMSNHSHKESI